MAYDEAPPSYADLAGDIQSGNFSTAPPSVPTEQPSAQASPAAMPYDSQYGITRNRDGSIYGFPGGVSVALGDNPQPGDFKTPADVDPDRISRFLAQHPEDIGNHPLISQPAAESGAPAPGSAPSLAPDDVQGLLAQGYSTSPGGPVVGNQPAPMGPTPGQQAAQDWVDHNTQAGYVPGPLHDYIEQPFQDFLHTATLGASDALPAAIAWGATGVKNAVMRAQGQTPPFSAADAYGAQHQALLDQESQFRQQHPRVDLGLTVTGALATPFPAGGFVARGLQGVPMLAKVPGIGKAVSSALTSTSMAGRMARAAPVGAAMGAGAGVMGANSVQDVIPSVVSGAAFGSVGGVGGEAVGASIAHGANAIGKRLIPQKLTPQMVAQAHGALKAMGIDGLPAAGQDMIERLLRQGAHPSDAAAMAAAHTLPRPLGMTRGQMSGDASQQWREAQALKGRRGPGAEMVAKGFRSDQQQGLRENVQGIGATLGGGRPIEPGQGGATASDALNAARDAKHAAVKAAYGAAESATNPAMLHSYDAKAVAGAVKQSVANYDPLRVPSVARELDRLHDLGASKQGIDARDLFRVRARLTALRASNDGVEASAAGAAVKAFDAEIHAAVSDGLMTGDPGTVDLWRKAIGERREFANLFQGNDLVEKLTAREPRSGRMQPAVDPHDASNIILGRSALGFVGRKNLYRDLNTVKDRLGASSAGWNGIRGEIFSRLANSSARTIDGTQQMDGERFQTLWQEFKKDDPQLLRTLYSSDEEALIDRFAGVAAKVTRNPRGAVGGSMGGSIRQTLQRLPFATLEGIPLIGHMADKIDAFFGQRGAMHDTVRAAPRLSPSTKAAPSLAVAGASGAQAFRRR